MVGTLTGAFQFGELCGLRTKATTPTRKLVASATSKGLVPVHKPKRTPVLHGFVPAGSHLTRQSFANGIVVGKTRLRKSKRSD